MAVMKEIRVISEKFFQTYMEAWQKKRGKQVRSQGDCFEARCYG